MFDALDPNSPTFWLRLGTAILCDDIIGLEHQLRRKTASIRTSILICLGTELFVNLGASFGGDQVDPTHVLAQMVTGIGFLRNGMILARENSIVGVTSATIIWVLATLGSTIELDYLAATITLTLITVDLLLSVELLESMFRRLRQSTQEREMSKIELEN